MSTQKQGATACMGGAGGNRLLFSCRHAMPLLFLFFNRSSLVSLQRDCGPAQDLHRGADPYQA